MGQSATKHRTAQRILAAAQSHGERDSQNISGDDSSRGWMPDIIFPSIIDRAY
ncbi:hypothetical protein SARC_11892, partial [Sphaeroforma arctica JP610]